MTDTTEPAGVAHITWVTHDGATGFTAQVTHETNTEWALDFCSTEISLPSWDLIVYLRNHAEDGTPELPRVAAEWSGPKTACPGIEAWDAAPEAARLVAAIMGPGTPWSPNLPEPTRHTVDGAGAWVQDLTMIGAGHLIFPDWT